jgi:hypothetical protein
MLLCVRTTVDLNDELFRRAKRQAVRERIPLRALIERALRAHLTGSRPRERYALRWRTEKGRLLPGVRLEDRDALFDAMDGR